MKLDRRLAEELGANLGRKREGQISHGLNLVLRLRRPADMPFVLAAIRQRQRKINAGLGELNFVHYARFLPTFDNRALQVITEFDGPLAPYVLDFAIEIGDVFDLLLSYTQGTEKIVPIAEHAAEFLAFVEKHNTVTVLPGMEIPDWPLYAAYPGQTVLDITGARDDLPIPKRDRWATVVQRDDVQGNILQGYRADQVKHFVLEVVDAPKARAWLANKATPANAPSGPVPQLTSFRRWAVGDAPELMLNIGLSFAGMKALGIRASWLKLFPEAFKQGAMERAKDNFDTGSNAPEHWWLGGPKQAAHTHVLVSLYHKPKKQQAFATAVQALRDSLPLAGLKLLAEHDALYRGGQGWFGYADGIAQPRIAQACPLSKESRDTDLQPAASAGEFILGANYKNIYGGNSLGALPAELATHGSFCAVRVLAQDEKLFEDTVNAEAARLGVAPDWLAAKLMGRWYDGVPLSLHPDSKPTDPAELAQAQKRNDFDYAPSYEYPSTPMDHSGGRCPVGAHIRRSNPRTARVAGARYARRLMRRGLHYELKGPDGLRQEVGLFGMFICADLERQFEFIQRQWINGDRFAAGLRGTRDPFVGAPDGAFHEFEIPMPPGREALKVKLPQLVHTRGSLYLFMPGLAALRQLETFATTDLPAAAPAADSPNPRNVLSGLQRRLKAKLARIGATLSEDTLHEIARCGIGNLIATDSSAPAARSAPPQQRLTFDPRRRDFQINPYPVFAQFRNHEPVHYSQQYKGWFVFGYEHVMRICTEDASFSAASLKSQGPRGLFTLDPPEHTIVRQKVQQAWTQAAAGADSMVTNSIDRALATIGTRPCFDLVDDFARPVPRDVYFDILGGRSIDAAERLVLDGLARRVMKHHDSTLDLLQRWDGLTAGVELSTRLALMLASARLGGMGRNSFLKHLAQQVDWLGGPFNPAVAVLTLLNLTVAGYMSVEFLLATGIRRLLLDRAEGWETLKSRPKLLPQFLQEMRRTEHALSVVDRFAKHDITDMGPYTIPKGDAVFGVLASANRDASIFGPDADRFDPHRLPHTRPHLALGYGTHECMGRILEGQITTPALNKLVSHLPDLRLDSKAEPPWFENFYFRSFDHLTVTTKT